MSFADENGTDPTDVAAKANTITVPYDPNDPVYWFRRLEIQMELRNIQSQFWKRVVLEANLAPEVNETIKDLLIKEKVDSATVYKDCKARILKIFGPKPEQDVTLALALDMTGLPSQAAKRIKELVCKRNFDCCCPAVVGKIWRDMLSKDVRVAVASYDLAKQWDEALDRADDVYKALQSFLKAEAKGTEVAAVSGTAPDEPELQPDVADVQDFDIDDRKTRGRSNSDFKRRPPPWENYTVPTSK